ncbi:hypothetical protein COY59_04540 [Candidatus Gottesmanbacteria bacterium CG_4_10_14_0_8_um_filter_37_24]|uniref:DUF3899 domain-containing protein n=2 Tax=Candidatus Gottesmaniibacteriota TaxID=1752720 RepID=A0A2M7RR02_9BACT|nr:MAG: hypothetical protein AUJ73_04995 [Candidatus Gottesmanbacteria bacterium CG1_02_37_22]PIP32950.1 MAG: hypothetical protein COX23_02025 [Candidatus Gottesmanbacteria bacterium CG23_combo_of_CG06-09_8_20_14_all_37_19]PIZ02479.1 MAG: hypothetical protein COY59_04540 [Candidatus Gottesmanbacteria bacterium CG_4_10_14_0_8_um_filter_37_24]
MNPFFITFLGIVIGILLVSSRSILLYAVFLLVIASYTLMLGVLQLNNKWYEKYNFFVNKIAGAKTEINPLTFKAIKFGSIVYFIVGVILLFISISLFYISSVQKSF